MKTINNFDFKGKKAIIRVDFNVPLDENYNVTDATRIEAAKPSIDKILNDGGSVILMSHLGRPKGKEEKYSLKHILAKVSEVLGTFCK
jgi:phosphoglycerate kinase